ncbi:hypothetical protein LXL04_034983 [Taraxacum kok-saghyz]
MIPVISVRTENYNKLYLAPKGKVDLTASLSRSHSRRSLIAGSDFVSPRLLQCRTAAQSTGPQSVLEIYTDAQTFGLKAASSKVVSIPYFPHSPCTKIQPIWTPGNQPRLSVNPQDRITGVAIICEPQSSDLSDNSPPLLKLGAVDLALLGKQDSGSLISMCIDPLIPERIYTIHNGGVDSIVLHFLPFTNQKNGKDDDDDDRAPSAQSIMSTWQVESRVAPLCGFVPVSDSFGCCWIVVLTSGFECVVIGMETWNLLLPNVSIDKEKKVGN